jgi:M6 family metalloprotease-like protein
VIGRRRSAFYLALLLILPAAPATMARAAGARPAAGTTLDVRRVAPAEALLRAQRAGRPANAQALTPAERAVLEARLSRERAFRPQELELQSRAGKVGAGINASRRPGWQPPLVSRAVRRFATDGAPPAPQDTVRLAIIRVDFLSDRGGSASSGDGRFILDPSDTVANPVDMPPHNRTFYRKHGEALARYYDVMSYGRVRVEADVWPAEEDSSYHLTDMADLGPWRFGSSIFRAAVDMFRKTFFAADSQSIAKNDRIPWDKYDRFMVIHAGSDLQSDIHNDSKEDIPSFTMFVDDTDRVIFPDSTTRPIDRTTFVPETINQDQAFGALNGVIAHENGHNFFGFGDVYDIETALPVVGEWSLMDSGNLVGARVQRPDGEIFAVGLLPPSVDPFQRNFILDQGLVNYRIPGRADTAAFPVMGSERHNDYVKLDLSSDEYVILENRYLSPAAAVHLLSDDTTHVVLGPRDPDRFEYDALLPGGGILAWHVDESVIPFTQSLRYNPDFGFNTNPRRLGLQVIEADGLDDLGDLGSPFALGSDLDPYQARVAPKLSDTTIPNLLPNQGTRPHLQIDFLDDTSDTMHVRVTRQWQPQGWPVVTNFPPGGPILLAADLDGDGKKDVIWAGGDSVLSDTSVVARAAVRDSAALFCVRFDGKGIAGADTFDFVHLDHRPRPEAAAFEQPGGAIVVATTYHYGAADAVGGKLWAVRADGSNVPGFPVTLQSPASTPPIVLRFNPTTWFAVVGCEDGRVREVDQNGAINDFSAAVAPGGVTGRLACWVDTFANGGLFSGWIALGSASGEVVVLSGESFGEVARWSVAAAGTAFAPDFLWAQLGGSGPNAAPPCAASQLSSTLFVHDRDRVHAFCLSNPSELPGWGAPFGDSLVAGLGAGDADGDGFPEVLVQTIHGRIAFLNASGHPSPGWPRAGSPESFVTNTPPLAVDVTGDGHPEVVALNASGVIAALDGNGRTPDGWPLATGAGCSGTTIATDLDGDGVPEIVAPDRFNKLYAYSVPGTLAAPATSWTMLGGDPGRMCALAQGATSSPSPASAGPLVSGSFKAYPNPARRKPVHFAYQLSEDSNVEFSILDTSGHQVAHWTSSGRRSDNFETWDPSGVPAGLYVARVRFSGPGGARTESVPLGILR